ncbi:MAG: lipoprotein-releasing system transmembrane subunit LolC [Syntrophobacteraceae bacterium CG07_land_8_20_14_0_80_61_8]|nr:MAG: lipoprotein-releasing system transmembrane subunit LolC [Syntrophobacteraceae bacterium CG07_land_8_20_14_0_80_61_8]
MQFELFISLRYLLAKRRQAFISLITLISMAGVALGVTALIVVLAVMNGFQEDLRERILGVTSHVVVGSYQGAIANYREVSEQVQEEAGVEAATPFIYTQVMISSGQASSGAILRGIDPATAGAVIRLDSNLTAGTLDDLNTAAGTTGTTGTAGAAGAADAEDPARPGLILGVELANRLGVAVNGWVTLITPGGRITPLGRMPKNQMFRIVGLFKSGMYEYDNTLAYTSLQTAQKFLGGGDTATGVELRVTDIYSASSISERLRQRLTFPLWVRDWVQMNHNLFSALKLEKVVMFIILTLIVLVAAFNIVSSLIMLVMEKTRDIAILKAMGATTASIRKIFVLEGLMIGIVGTALGLLGGFGLCTLLKNYQFIELPRDVYYISTLPVHLQPLDVVVIAISAVTICLIATVYPSFQAARLNPVEALRYE